MGKLIRLSTLCRAACLAALLPCVASRADYKPSDRVLIQELTASASATVNFTKGIDSTYDVYVVEFWGVRPATDDVKLCMRMSTDGGSTWKAGATDYWYAVKNLLGEGVTYSGGTTMLALVTGEWATSSVGNAANEDANGWVRIYAPSSTGMYKHVLSKGAYSGADGGNYQSSGAGAYKATTAVNGFQFLFSSGNITAGTFRLYGIR